MKIYPFTIKDDLTPAHMMKLLDAWEAWGIPTEQQLAWAESLGMMNHVTARVECEAAAKQLEEVLTHGRHDDGIVSSPGSGWGGLVRDICASQPSVEGPGTSETERQADIRIATDNLYESYRHRLITYPQLVDGLNQLTEGRGHWTADARL